MYKTWGQPDTKEKTQDLGREMMVWEYKNQSGQVKARFLLDAKAEEILEMTYIPSSIEKEKYDLPSFLKEQFEGVSFEKIVVSCRHWNELILAES